MTHSSGLQENKIRELEKLFFFLRAVREGSIILFFNADVNFAIEDNLIFEIKKKKRGGGWGRQNVVSLFLEKLLSCQVKGTGLSSDAKYTVFFKSPGTNIMFFSTLEPPGGEASNFLFLSQVQMDCAVWTPVLQMRLGQAHF